MDTKGDTQEQKAATRASIPSGDETERDASTLEEQMTGEKGDRKKVKHKHRDRSHSKHGHKHHHKHHSSRKDDAATKKDTRKHRSSRATDNKRTSKTAPPVSKTTDPPIPPPPLIPTKEDVSKVPESETKARYRSTTGRERVAKNNSQMNDHKKHHQSNKSSHSLPLSEALTLSDMEKSTASDVARAPSQPPGGIVQSAKTGNQEIPFDSSQPSHNEKRHHSESPVSPPSSQPSFLKLALDNSDVSPSNQAHGDSNVNIASTTPSSQPSFLKLALDNSNVSPSNQAHGDSNVNIASTTTNATRSQPTRDQSTQDCDIESNTRPGAFAVHGVDESNDDDTVRVGGETVMVSADLVDTATEEQLRERLSETEMERARLEAERARLEAERNQIVDAEEVRVENNELGTDEGKHRIVRWATAFVALLVVVLAIVLGVVFGRGGKSPLPTLAPTAPPTLAPTAPPTPAPTTPPTPAPPPPDLDELVALFSDTSPATATALKNKTSNQYQAMEWLAKDVEENGFGLITGVDRILARGALAILFYSTNGDGWIRRTRWLDHGVSECDWDSVECTSGIVTKLDLYSDNLEGTLPLEIHLLSTLEYLHVGWNSISGTIPTEIARLTNLRTLSLQFNKFTGTLPSEFGLLTNLVVLHVYSNSLTGTVPIELGQLKKLEWLSLFNNEFTGQVPSQVCAIDSLINLWADCGGTPPKIECTCCTTCCPGGHSACD